MIKNTILLSLYSLLWGFPIPVILALMMNQLRFHRFKRITQTVLYAPHFISTMVICGMIRIFLSPSGGLINLIAGTSIDFLTESSAFRTIYIASGIWQDAGWGIIVYMATLANVDTSLYEAAKVDGASLFQRIIHIDIPELAPIMVLNLIMSAGKTFLLPSGFTLEGYQSVFADPAILTGLINNMWALFLPGGVAVGNLIIVRNFFENSIPKEMIEAADIDGASKWETFIKIVVPLSRSSMAVMVVFSMVAYWNDWFTSMIYLPSPSKAPLPLVLRNILIKSSASASQTSTISGGFAELNKMTEMIKFSSIIIAALPMLIIYPFVQKYFEKGFMAGAVKG